MAVPSPARILLVRLSHLGDVLHALPVFHALRSANPEAEIAWAIQPEFEDVLGGLDLARVFHFDRRGGPGAWLKLRRACREWRPDWAVDAQGNVKSGFAALVSGARRRTGLARRDWKERFGARLVNDHAPPADGRHAVHRMLALAEHVAPASQPRFDLPLDPALRDRGRARFAERMGTDDRRRWILHVGVEEDVRTWPAAHYAELARRLADGGDRVLVMSGPAEREIGARIESEMSSREDIDHWVGQAGLADLAAFFAAAGEAGARLVAGDTGPLQLAAAVGLPVRLLAGPQDPARTGPWPPATARDSPHVVLWSDEPPECMPCLSRTCRHAEGPVCLTGLSPERVATELAGR